MERTLPSLTDDERSPLLGSDSIQAPDSSPAAAQEHTLYKIRWYILLVFASLACVQGALCVVWTVVAESSEAAFGWTNSDLSLMMLWLYITYLVGMGPFAWLIQNKGMRVSMILAALLVFLGALCRIVSSTPPLVTWMAHLGHVFNGLAGPVLFSGSAVISSLWFPPHQRATATAVSTVFGFSGGLTVFLLEPNVIPPPKRRDNFMDIGARDSKGNVTNIPDIRDSIMMLRYAELGVTAFLFVLVLVHFPARPPQAPSTSASAPTLSFWRGLRKIFSLEKINFWYAALPSCIAPGVYGVFNSMLDVNLKDVSVSQVTVGWINFYTIFGSGVFGMLLGRLGDKCIGYRKMLLMLSIVIGALACFATVLIVGQYIPFHIVGLYISLIILGVMVNGTMPLYYETCIEATYPIPESVTMGVITAVYNIFPAFFLLVFLIPNIGTFWMNWFMYVAIVACAPILFLFKERYDRLSLDISVSNEVSSNIED